MSDDICKTVHPPDSWAGTARALVVTAGAVSIVWLEHGAWKLALGVLALLAAPSLAKALTASRVARSLLKP